MFIFDYVRNISKILKIKTVTKVLLRKCYFLRILSQFLISPSFHLVPTHQWHRLMAESLFHSGDYAGARDHYLQCPQTGDIFSRLEICCRELGDYRMAYHYAKLQ